MRLKRRCPRLFKGQIFLGNGEHSERLVDILRQRFEDAIVILGGEQQNGLIGYKFDKEESKKSIKELEYIVKDIGAALLGRQIKIERPLKYPWKEPQELIERINSWGHSLEKP